MLSSAKMRCPLLCESLYSETFVTHTAVQSKTSRAHPKNTEHAISPLPTHNIHTPILIHTHTHTHLKNKSQPPDTHTYTHTHTHARSPIHTHTRRHTHAYTHTHTHAHT